MTRDGWFKSSFSSSGGDSCVEVRMAHQSVHVRDTKNRAAGTLHFGQSAWVALIGATALSQRSTPES